MKRGEGLVSSQNGAFSCLVFMTWYMKVIKLPNGVLFFYHLSLHHTHSEARVTLAMTSASVVSLNEDIHKEHPQNCSESHFMSILLFDFSKTSVISYTHRTVKVFTATHHVEVRLNLEDTAAKIY